MNQPRASRLTRPADGSSGPLTGLLPYGTWQRKLVFRAVLPLVGFAFLVLIMDKIVMPSVTRQGSEFPLPDFTQQRVLEAQISLEKLDLSYEVASEEFSPGKPPGTILRQIPPPQTKVKPGRMIKFIVSLGQKMVPIPEVAGKSVRQAILELEGSGLKLGEIAWALSDTLPEKVVVFSYPPTGTEIPMGGSVNLMVKHGRASRFTFMPNVVGQTIDEARDRIEAKYLRVGVIEFRTDENYLPETVLEQSEPHGAELDIGTEIDLVLSSTD